MLHSVAPGRVHISHATKRPKYNLVCRAPYLAARKSVAELMQHHNEKNSEVFGNIPANRRITAAPCVDLVHRHEKP